MSSFIKTDDRFAPGPGFDWQPRTRVVFGAGCLERLGEVVRENGGTRALLVTDPGVAAAGHADRGVRSLEASGVAVAVFDDVTANPTTGDVDRGLAVARRHDADFLVGLGGGSSMDVAKGVNFVLSCGGRMADYAGIGRATGPLRPSVGVPTTAGTGSEAQSFALIADADTHRKMACGDRRAAFRAALLDPDLLATVPRSVAAAVGIDAVSHALETAVTKPRSELSDLFGRRAWVLLSGHLANSLSPDATDADRAAMLLGSHLAGAAIELSMLGAAHALANPVTAAFGTTHGHAVGVMLPHVIRHNAADPAARTVYADRAAAAGLCAADDPAAADTLAACVTRLLRSAGVPTTLGEHGVTADRLPALAAEAADQWTATFNPVPVTAEDLEGLYRCAMNE